MHCLILNATPTQIECVKRKLKNEKIELHFIDHLNSCMMTKKQRASLCNSWQPIPLLSAKGLMEYMRIVVNVDAKVYIFLSKEIELSKLDGVSFLKIKDSTFNLPHLPFPVVSNN